MATKKPTNSDLYREIVDTKKEVKEVKKIVMGHDADIKSIQNRNARIDAVSEYVAAHPDKENPNLTKALVTALSIIAALVTAYIGLK